MDALSDFAFESMACCIHCRVYTANGPDHVCVVYDGPPCTEPGCELPTVGYTVGAPGYGCGRVCAAGHDEHLSPQGILTPGQVR